MDIRTVLKGQYHGALLMLKEAIEQCPDELWGMDGDSRSAWRIAYHTLFYTHIYLQQTEHDFGNVVWNKARKGAENVWGGQPEMPAYSKADTLEYWTIVDSVVDSQLDTLDLESQESGFSWYSIPKLDHVIMNLRHIQEHTGQLRDRLFQAGGDARWIGMA
jgi:hypothetical protein